MANRKYLVYKMTNRFDGKIYIGCHSTFNKNDRYMGSGVEIKEALKKYGRKSFIKEILFEFDTKEEMLAKEKELVTKEFCMREDTYNRIEGGGVYCTQGMVSVKDKNGNNLKVYLDDPRYLSGELVSNMKGFRPVKDKQGNHFIVEKNDPRYISGELLHVSSGTILVEIDGNIERISEDDSRWISGELNGWMKGKTQHPNVSWKDKKHLEKTKQKMSEKAKQRIGDKNSSFGTCWITKENENKKIKKEDLEVYLQQGWIKGRKLKSMNV